MKQPAVWILFSMLALAAVPVLADGNIIDKVYDPYVQPLEHELEYRLLIDDDRQSYTHKLGYGAALSERFFAELNLSGEDLSGTSLEVEGIEFEGKLQLTEQGEYANDWALMLELEREISANAWEAATTVIMLHDWGRWVGTVNASLIHEWGERVNNEWETALSGQLKFRHRRELEPGIEFFAGQNTRALGPVLMGVQRLHGGRQSLQWEAGLLAGLDQATADLTLKLQAEYEF